MGCPTGRSAKRWACLRGMHVRSAGVPERRRPGAVAQESLPAGVVAGGDADRGIDAEATGRLPGVQVGDGGLVEEFAAQEEAEHAATQRLLKPLDVPGSRVARLVEVNGTVGVRGEEAIEDDEVEVEVEVGVEGGAEAVKEGDGAELGVRRSIVTESQEERADRPQQDAEHGSGERRVPGQERTPPLRQREDPLANGQRRQDLVAEMGGDLHHAAGVTGGADPTALAGKGDQTLGAAVSATGAGEAVGQDAAAQIGAEVVLGPAGDCVAAEIVAGGQGRGSSPDDAGRLPLGSPSSLLPPQPPEIPGHAKDLVSSGDPWRMRDRRGRLRSTIDERPA